MAASRNWFPGIRTGQLAMARNRITVTVPKASAWGLPHLTELSDLADAVESVLTVAINEATRTPAVTARCKAAFDTLLAKMRCIKNHYFLVPPLLTRTSLQGVYV
jgi:hypothetical protein